MNDLQPPLPTRGGGLAGDGYGGGLVRTYQAWKGNNVFLLGGRLIFGPDARSLFITISIIVAPIAVFCIFVARKLLDDFRDDLGIFIMAVVIALTIWDIILLLLTSGRDPGIVPRNSHPPEPEGYEGNTEYRPGQTPPVRLPRTKDLVLSGVGTFKVKYCDTCMLYRHPRCSHCSICNNCVEKFDHHCPWVGQCIGLRNYRFFFMFVFTTTLLCLYVHAFCWVYIRRIKDSEEISLWKAMIKSPASIVLLIYTFIAVWFVGGLTVFHLYLISTNQSTYENFRYGYDRHHNPFNKGIISNFMDVFCTGIPRSKNHFRAKISREPEISPRMVASDFLSPSKVKNTGDIEMGRKAVWEEGAEEVNDLEGQQENDGNAREYSRMPDVSPDLSRILPPEGIEGRGVLHHTRHASRGRTSERWEISPEILPLSRLGESKRTIGNGNKGVITES